MGEEEQISHVILTSHVVAIYPFSFIKHGQNESITSVVVNSINVDYRTYGLPCCSILLNYKPTPNNFLGVATEKISIKRQPFVSNYIFSPL